MQADRGCISSARMLCAQFQEELDEQQPEKEEAKAPSPWRLRVLLCYPYDLLFAVAFGVSICVFTLAGCPPAADTGFQPGLSGTMQNTTDVYAYTKNTTPGTMATTCQSYVNASMMVFDAQGKIPHFTLCQTSLCERVRLPAEECLRRLGDLQGILGHILTPNYRLLCVDDAIRWGACDCRTPVNVDLLMELGRKALEMIHTYETAMVHSIATHIPDNTAVVSRVNGLTLTAKMVKQGDRSLFETAYFYESLRHSMSLSDHVAYAQLLDTIYTMRNALILRDIESAGRAGSYLMPVPWIRTGFDLYTGSRAASRLAAAVKEQAVHAGAALAKAVDVRVLLPGRNATPLLQVAEERPLAAYTLEGVVPYGNPYLEAILGSGRLPLLLCGLDEGRAAITDNRSLAALGPTGHCPLPPMEAARLVFRERPDAASGLPKETAGRQVQYRAREQRIAGANTQSLGDDLHAAVVTTVLLPVLWTFNYRLHHGVPDY